MENIYSDPENVCYTALGLYKGVAETFFSPATPVSMLKRLTTDRMADLRDIMTRWKPWTPPKQDQAFQQGGQLVLRGDRTLFFHKDLPAFACSSACVCLWWSRSSFLRSFSCCSLTRLTKSLPSASDAAHAL